ncbi:MAG: LysR family transcriptional regulator [Nannocystaceae bacterium]|jgi:DNA-binding transcriptional LysR family regulator
MDWDDVRFFLAIVRSGTLAGAATALGIDATTVGRRLARLEQSMDARLFDRTAKGYVATAAGQRILPRAEKVEREILAALRDVEGEDQRLAGQVRLTATEMLSTRFIAPHLHRFNRRYPDIKLELLCTNRDVDLGRREADIALRLARPHQDDVVVKRLFLIELGLYASHGYVQELGLPGQNGAQGFAGHRFIGFADTRAFRRENEWVDEHAPEALVSLRSDSVSSIMSAAIAGVGLALLPCRVADAEPALLRVPLPDRSDGPDTGPEPRIVWQAVHRDLMGAARIRAVLDFLGRLFGAADPVTAARASATP